MSEGDIFDRTLYTQPSPHVAPVLDDQAQRAAWAQDCAALVLAFIAALQPTLTRAEALELTGRVWRVG